jgi:hypothetical protein
MIKKARSGGPSYFLTSCPCLTAQRAAALPDGASVRTRSALTLTADDEQQSLNRRLPAPAVGEEAGVSVHQQPTRLGHHLGSNGQQAGDDRPNPAVESTHSRGTSGAFQAMPSHELHARSTVRPDAAPVASERPRSETEKPRNRSDSRDFLKCPRQESNLDLPLRRTRTRPARCSVTAAFIGVFGHRRLGLRGQISADPAGFRQQNAVAA